MQLYDRDRQICNLVNQFTLLSSSQIFRAVFAPSPSHTPCDRALRRLIATGELARVEHRRPGGTRGGSGQYVYQLGPEGHRYYREGRYNPRRTLSGDAFHLMAIADIYIALRELELAGKLKVLGYQTEPDCHAVIGGVYLEPDLYAELQRPGGNPVPMFFEMDMGSEKDKQLKEKLVRYSAAADRADGDDVEVFPLVLWVAYDDVRREHLRWLLGKGDEKQRRLFRLTTLGGLKASLGG